MPLTYLQTVEILYPNTTLVHYGQEPRPVAPEWVLQSSEPEAIVTSGSATVWWKNGLCEVYEPNGTVRRFWPKPTLADAVLLTPCAASYYRFHPDGSVEEIYKGMHYWWGPQNLDAPEVLGEALAARVERCEDVSPFASYSLYDRTVRFDLSPNGYLWNRPCDCSECYFEERTAAYRRRKAAACSCIECREDDDYSVRSY
jgi:hypothetical protein